MKKKKNLPQTMSEKRSFAGFGFAAVLKTSRET
jgi:hypothetical protein